MLSKPNSNFRTYIIAKSCIFKKNDGEFGGLSNMSTSFIFNINGLSIVSTESIYQALKFPDNHPLQLDILNERSPYKAKGIARSGVERADWKKIRITVMRWCLRVKLAQNYHSFGSLLRSTGSLDIVEYSSTDNFWGADKDEPGKLYGQNALGRLLMELRDFYLNNSMLACTSVNPPNTMDLTLLGRQIESVDHSGKYVR